MVQAVAVCVCTGKTVLAKAVATECGTPSSMFPLLHSLPIIVANRKIIILVGHLFRPCFVGYTDIHVHHHNSPIAVYVVYKQVYMYLYTYTILELGFSACR